MEFPQVQLVIIKLEFSFILILEKKKKKPDLIIKAKFL